jgi:hypothetical protein
VGDLVPGVQTADLESGVALGDLAHEPVDVGHALQLLLQSASQLRVLEQQLDDVLPLDDLL